MKMTKPIYLDYMATTPLDPRITKLMLGYLELEGVFGNSSSVTHVFGKEAAEAIEKSRQQVADIINAKSHEIIWTSGATEANNLAILGAARFYSYTGKKHIITYQTEHKAVLDPCVQLAREGFEISYLKPKRNGLIDIDELQANMRSDTLLVSVMHVNNEIGVIQDLTAIGAMTRPRGVLLHVDAAQSVGKCLIDISAMKIDLLSISGHKIYAPKGIGALFCRYQPRVRLEPLMYGGGQEMGLRAGTLPTVLIVALGEACRIACAEMIIEQTRLKKLRDQLWKALNEIGGVVFHGCLEKRVAGNLNFSIEGVNGEALIASLDELAISSGSACNSASIEPSHVIRALGVKDLEASNSIRISLGRFTSEAEILKVIALFQQQITRLRAISKGVCHVE